MAPRPSQSRSYALKDGMAAKPARSAPPKLSPATADFYAQMVRALPWGMTVLHVRNSARGPIWTKVAANARAKRLLGSNFDKRLELPILREGKLSEQPIDVAGAIRDALDQGRGKLLGHIAERMGNQPTEIYAVHALPLGRSCVAVVLHDVSRDARARRDQKGAEARLEQICRAARAIQWTADSETLEFKSVTPEARTILGYWIERWRSEPDFWRNHAHPDDWETIRSRCSGAAMDEGAGHFECRMFDTDGKIHWFKVHLTAHQPHTGRAELSGVMVDITDQKQNEQAARELSAHVMRAEERERKRISRDLHDSVGQNLTGLHWSLARLGRSGSSGARLREELKECAQLVQVCMDEVRAVSQALHPPAIDLLGLAPALEWQAKRFAEQSALTIHLDIPERIDRMDPDCEIAMFRVFQECLSNVRRHAKTDAVTVRLQQESSAVLLEVEDRGVGVPTDLFEHLTRGRRGIGVLKMRERLAELGGTLEIVPNEPGTKVRARVPQVRRPERAPNEHTSLRESIPARRKSGRR